MAEAKDVTLDFGHGQVVTASREAWSKICTRIDPTKPSGGVKTDDYHSDAVVCAIGMVRAQLGIDKKDDKIILPHDVEGLLQAVKVLDDFGVKDKDPLPERLSTRIVERSKGVPTIRALRHLFGGIAPTSTPVAPASAPTSIPVASESSPTSTPVAPESEAAPVPASEVAVAAAAAAP